MPNKQRELKGLTSEIKINRCYGCGVILQSDNPMDVGYISKDRLNLEDQLCERCYKLRHYGEVKQNSPSFGESYIKLLSDVNKKDALIVYVMDAFTIEGSILKDIHPYLQKNTIVVLNKKDILPRDFPEDKLVAKIRQVLKQDNVNPLDILLISSAKNINMDEFMSKLETLRKGKDVYFVGANNVGKSSIINKILKNYKNKTDKLITTSKYPGTTLGIIGIPLDNVSYMFDTPGIFNPKSVISQMEKEILKYIIPRDQINPRNYQLDDQNSLIFGGIARFDYVSKNQKEKGKCGYTIYMSNDIDIERTKLSKADNTLVSIILQNKTHPIAKSIKEVKDLEKHEYILPIVESGTINITITGLGSIMTQGKGQAIAVYAPKNVEVKIEHIDYRA